MQPIDPAARAQVLSARTTFEAQGAHVTDDGSYLLLAAQPAAGWRFSFGAQQGVIGSDGLLSLQPPTDGATQITLAHPSDGTLTFALPPSAVGTAHDTGTSLIIPLLFRGACGMRGADDGSCCSAGCPQTKMGALWRAADRPNNPDDGLRPRLHYWNDRRNVTRDVLGTYPVTGTELHGSCPIDDGYFYRSELGFVASYAYSTCDVVVQAGGCPNENPGSDAEYKALFAQLSLTSESSLGLSGGQAVLAQPLTYGQRLHCGQNHKRRNCSQLVIGDISLQLPDKTIVRPDEQTTLELTACGANEVTLHNNGVFGITRVKLLKSDLGTTLKSPNLVKVGGEFEVRHYLPVNYVADYESDNMPTRYLADLPLTIELPPAARAGAEDVYLLQVDDRQITLHVKFREGGCDTKVFEPGGQIFDVTSTGDYVRSNDKGETLWSIGGIEQGVPDAFGFPLMNDSGDMVMFRGQAQLPVVRWHDRQTPDLLLTGEVGKAGARVFDFSGGWIVGVTADGSDVWATAGGVPGNTSAVGLLTRLGLAGTYDFPGIVDLRVNASGVLVGTMMPAAGNTPSNQVYTFAVDLNQPSPGLIFVKSAPYQSSATVRYYSAVNASGQMLGIDQVITGNGSVGTHVLRLCDTQGDPVRTVFSTLYDTNQGDTFAPLGDLNDDGDVVYTPFGIVPGGPGAQLDRGGKLTALKSLVPGATLVYLPTTGTAPYTHRYVAGPFVIGRAWFDDAGQDDRPVLINTSGVK